MTEREALLRAVCENPDDDTPRLVFADWLDEHGEPEWAEFIRLQIRLASVAVAEQDPADVAREQDLLLRHRDDWTAPLKEFESSRGDHYEFCRGFVQAMSADAEVMEEEGNRLFALSPVRVLYFNDAEEFGGLAKCKWLLRLHTLDLKGSGLSHHFNPAPLLKSRYLANLTTLGLGGEDDNGHLDEHGVRALLASKHLGRLETLDLSGNWLDEATFAHFLTATNLPALRNLSLERVGIGDAGAVALAAAPLVRQLRSLNLARCDLGDAGIRALAESPLITGIERIDLRRNGLANAVSPGAERLLRERFGDRVWF